jgi:transcriptional regulator with XRE-family HTH domain
MPTKSTDTATMTQPPFRTVRLAKGLRLARTAELAGIDKGHLSRVERGQAGLSIDALHRLAVVLELSELARLLEPYAARPTTKAAA